MTKIVQQSTNLVDGEHLTITLLDLLELPQEVPIQDFQDL